MASEKTKIAVCPYCGDKCQPSLKHDTYYFIEFPCGATGPLFEKAYHAIAAHNELCADIERGKQLDQMLTLFKLNPERRAFADTMQGELWIEIVVAYIRLLEGRGELAAEAIDLLDEYSSTSNYIKRVANFLDLPAVAEIIAAQKDGG